MKKRKGFIIAVLIGVLILAGIIITVWTAYMRKSFPQEASYCIFDVYAGNENGLYYSKNNILYYLDRATQEIVQVCAKPDCNHTSDTCNAYYGGIGPNIMLYGEYIFVSYFMVDYNVNEEEKKLEIDSTSYLECCRLDGSDRKIIFQSDNGSVTNMMARDGKLYFTGFSYQSELAEEKMDYDNYLYCYDMVWGTTKTLLHYKWDELHNNAGLELIKNMDGKEIFLQYGYEDKEGNRESMVLQYMGKDQTKEIFSASKGNPIPESTKMYVQNDVFYTNNARNDWDMCCFASIKPDGTMEEMAVVPEGDMQELLSVYKERNRVKRDKCIIMVEVITIFFMIIYLPEYLWVWNNFTLEGGDFTIKSLSLFSGTWFSGSIKAYLLCMYSIRYVTALLVGGACVLLGRILKNTNRTILIGGILFLLPLLIHLLGVEWIDKISLNAFLSGNMFLRR